MDDDIYCERGGRRTWLKWHRARRRAGDPAFTGARILEGMWRGASVEVDLLIHKERGYAVLHDTTLEAETTGSGAVAEASAAELRALQLRADDGTPTDQHVMLLEDLTALVAQGDLHPDALLQLDFKEDAAALDAAAIASFKASVAPVARHMILSAGDAEAVALLSDGVAGLRIGYDPCYGALVRSLEQTGDFAAFAAGTLTEAPDAEMIYLYYPLVLDAADAGFDIVAAMHSDGRRVDAWTIQRADAAAAPAVRRLLDLGVDQITTDDAEGLGALIRGLA
jgi:glycerophosphoryl diester phosphodiesterase